MRLIERRPEMRKPAVLVGIVAAAVVVSVAAAGTERAAGARLTPFRSCSELLEYAKDNAAKVVGLGGVLRPPGAVSGVPVEGGARAAGADYSTTNDQEKGVDEPDLVKTDGSRLYAVAGGKLYAVDTRGAKPRLLGSLRLEGRGDQQLLLRGGRILALTTSVPIVEPVVGREAIAPYAVTTVLSEIDVRNPAAMHVVKTLTLDGAYVAARLSGATARVVVASTPRLPPVSATVPVREAVASTTLQDWLPYSVLEDRRTHRTTKRALVQCRAVRRPPLFSGLGLTTIVTIDLDRGLAPVDSDALMSDARTVYASTGRLYLASQRWLAVPADRSGSPPSQMTTELHEYDVSRPGRTAYRASGSVPGFLLNQWSLSEYRGNLRVATTDLPSWWSPSPQRESTSRVTVLAERGGALVATGEVGALGRGERVFGVRFIGDVGYVVTFRQVDPLYTIDLADPARPRVLGELVLRGYSAYLHPVGKDLLLGIGQDTTEEGRLAGTQLELFDVSDLRRPVRLDAVRLGPGSSEVEYDHHAFLYWPAKSLAVLPVQIAAKTPFVGAIAYRVARRSVDQLARITHPGGAPIRRSLVVGDRLFTVSQEGAKASGLDSLADVDWLAFS